MSINHILAADEMLEHLVYPALANEALRRAFTLRIAELQAQITHCMPPDDPLQFPAYIATLKALHIERNLYTELLRTGTQLVQRFGRIGSSDINDNN